MVASLRFLFAQMGAGKTAALLSTAFHLRQAGLRVAVLTSNDRVDGQVSSRVGLRSPATVVGRDVAICRLLAAAGQVDHILVDEAQFLTAGQVDELAWLVDEHGVEVTCYGLRADAFEALFEGSARLFAVADRIEELQVEARCWCAASATHNARTRDGALIRTGVQVVVDDGGDVAYEPLCRRHYRAGQTRAQAGVAVAELVTVAGQPSL